MNMIVFGKIIKELRKKAGFTQAELAKQLCSVNHIYKIEKGIRLPSADLLTSLSAKLRTDLVEFIILSDNQHPFEVKEYLDRMKKLRVAGRYEELALLLDKAKNHPDFSSPQNSQYLKIHQAILLYEIDKAPKQAYHKFLDAFQNTRHFNSIYEIDYSYLTYNEALIINGLIKCIHDLYGKKETHKLIHMVVERFFSNSTNELNHKSIVLLHHTYITTLAKHGDLDKAYQLVCDQINNQLVHDSLYLLAEFYYIKGIIESKWSQEEKSTTSLQQALVLAQIKGQQQFASLVAKKISPATF